MSSMVVHDIDLKGVPVLPAKADSPLVVDPDAVLPASIAAEFLQPVAERHAKIVQILGAVELHSRNPASRLRKLTPSGRLVVLTLKV